MSLLTRLYLYACQADASAGYRRERDTLTAYYPHGTVRYQDTTQRIWVKDDYLNLYLPWNEPNRLKGLQYHEVHFVRPTNLSSAIKNSILARRVPRV